jgi:uncharacterized membrane protein
MATDTGKSALGLDGNLAAALGYPIGILAIICLIIEKENRFVKFHALQSLLLHVAMFVLAIAAMIIFMILGIVLGVAAAASNSAAGGGIAGIFGLLSTLIWLVIVVGYVAALIYAAVKAYQGNMLKLPIIGSMAQKWTGG